MTKVIGVRFRTAGKVYYFDPLQLVIKRGDHVIVETARGIEFGTVVSGVHEVEDSKVIQPLKPVLRLATERDKEQEASNKEREREAYRICLEKIRKHELDMKLIDAEYTFDNNKVLFYFTADGRIDFRELVKDLAGVFKTRIELRQIGVRDETKIMGGIGICGRPLCCHSYLADFVPVSIKMAKEQNLSLNPTKISGVCGRLMCCLKNEQDTYEELNRRLPGIGDMVTTDDGFKGEVQSVNVLRQTVKVVVENGDEKEIRDYTAEQIQFRKKHGKKEKVELSREELKELERLEKEELQEDTEVKDDSGSEKQSDRRSQRRNENRGENKKRGENENRTDNKKRGENENRAEGKNRGENRSRGENKNRSENKNFAEEEVQSGNDTRAEVENPSENRKQGENKPRRNRRNNRRRDKADNNAGESSVNKENQRAQENSGSRENQRAQEGAGNQGNQKSRENAGSQDNQRNRDSKKQNPRNQENNGDRDNDAVQQKKKDNRRRRGHGRREGRTQEKHEE